MYNKKMILGGGWFCFVFLSPLKFSSYSRWKYHSFSCINTLDKWTAASSPLGGCGGRG